MPVTMWAKTLCLLLAVPVLSHRDTAEAQLHKRGVTVDCQTGLRVEYDVINEHGSVGDIIIGPMSKLASSSCIEMPVGLNAESFGDRSGHSSPEAFAKHATLWPAARVPYIVDSSASANLHTAIQRAIEQMTHFTPIRFVPAAPSDSNRVVFKELSVGCGRSSVGMVGGAQVIEIDSACIDEGTVVHEMLHAIGMVHTQTRPDRDEYLMVDPCVPNDVNFGKQEIRSFGAYDYASIMHYERQSARSSCTGNALTPTYPVHVSMPRWRTCPTVVTDIGNRCSLSFGDVNAIWYFYGSQPLPPRQLTSGQVAGLATLLVSHAASDRPDALIATKPLMNELVGDGIYNTTGRKQRLATSVAQGQKATFRLVLQNDGSGTNAVIARGRRSSNGFSVRYLDKGVDVTELVAAGVYRTRPLPAGSKAELRIVVRADDATRGSEFVNKIKVSSEIDAGSVDVVEATVTVQ